MSPSANVLAIHALEDLRGALVRFAGEAHEALQSTEQEIHRTLDWLQERLNYWQNQVYQRQTEVAQAKAALARCRASGYRDREGNYHPPNCSTYEQALLQAQLRLRQAEAELHNVQRWARLVQQSVADYQGQARRLAGLLGDDLPKATATLSTSVSILQSYTTMPAQTTFRQAMAGITPPDRGRWGEQAVLKEAQRHGHRILLEHGGKATTPGYDCVSWDGQTLHIWEAKNYSAANEGEAGVVRDLGALDSDRRRASAEQFLRDLPLDDPERPIIAEAIQQDRVQWHIRLGPDTDISFSPLENLGWGHVEVKQYSYDEMVDIFAVQEPAPLPGPTTPPEIREGGIGGSERGG